MRDQVDRSIREYTMDPDADGLIREVGLTSGPSRGMRVLEVANASGLQLDILLDRALDIGRVSVDGRPVSWNSPTGYRHPAYWNGTDENGTSLMRGMTGLLVTGGLDHIFAPRQRDGSAFAYPTKVTQDLPLHGRISNTPASSYTYWKSDDSLHIEGTIFQVAVFGEAFQLKRKIEIPLNRNVIRITDTVTNIGFEDYPHYILYHVNLGWPLLSEHARFSADVIDRPWATANLDEAYALSHFPAPHAGAREQCAQFRIRPDALGWKEVRVENDRDLRSCSLRWKGDTLPDFVQWINPRSGSYAVGLEPCSHGAVELRDHTGQPHTLKPAESRSYALELSFDRLKGPANDVSR